MNYLPGIGDKYTNNSCILYPHTESILPNDQYASMNCDPKNPNATLDVFLHNNSYFTKNEKAFANCRGKKIEI